MSQGPSARWHHEDRSDLALLTLYTGGDPSLRSGRQMGRQEIDGTGRMTVGAAERQRGRHDDTEGGYQLVKLPSSRRRCGRIGPPGSYGILRAASMSNSMPSPGLVGGTR